MSFRKDFQDFVFRGNVVDLAVGVMVGAAFGKIVGAAVDDLMMPLVSAVLPEGGWRSFAVELSPKVKLQVGHLLGVVIDFVITAAVLFIVLVKFVGFLRTKAPAAAPAGHQGLHASAWRRSPPPPSAASTARRKRSD